MEPQNPDRPDRFDSQSSWKHYEPTRSNVFFPGERLQTTLFTIIGPGWTDRYGKTTWREVKVLCDPQYGGCGKEVILPYYAAYQHPARYSCGCKRRRVWSERDHSGESVTGYQTNRKLTILWLDERTSEWVYVCECCGDTGTVPRGQGQTTIMKLKALARVPCEHVPRFYTIDQLPDIMRHTLLTTKTRIDADLIEQLNRNYPGCKLVYGGYENRIYGIETTIRPNHRRGVGSTIAP